MKKHLGSLFDSLVDPVFRPSSRAIFAVALAVVFAGCSTSTGGGAAIAAVDASDASVGSDASAGTDAGADSSTADVGTPDTSATDAAGAETAGADVAADDGTATDAGAASATVTSKAGTYKVLLYGPLAIAAGQKAAWTAHILDASGLAVPGLTVKVSFIHAAMGHGGSAIPKVADSGDGDYAVTNGVATMSGVWWLELKIGTDSVTFNIDVK